LLLVSDGTAIFWWDNEFMVSWRISSLCSC